MENNAKLWSWLEEEYGDPKQLKAHRKLKEYWWEDNDPMNWSDMDPLVYKISYKGKDIGYVQFAYRGEEQYPDDKEIRDLAYKLTYFEELPEDVKIEDGAVEFELVDNYSLDDSLELIEESLEENLEEASSAETKAFKNGGQDLDDLIQGKAIARIKDPEARDAAVAAVKAGRTDVVKQFTGDRKEDQAAAAFEKKAQAMADAGVTENLEEHINDRPADIESDQELQGIDNAVVDCEVAKVIAHSEDEKPLDCKMEKPALEEPLAGEEVDIKINENLNEEANEEEKPWILQQGEDGEPEFIGWAKSQNEIIDKMVKNHTSNAIGEETYISELEDKDWIKDLDVSDEDLERLNKYFGIKESLNEDVKSLANQVGNRCLDFWESQEQIGKDNPEAMAEYKISDPEKYADYVIKNVYTVDDIYDVIKDKVSGEEKEIKKLIKA